MQAQPQPQLEDVVWVPRRSTIDPAAPILRRGDKRLAGVAGAVAVLTVGLANILPGGGGAASVVMASADSTNQLHGIGLNEPLPTVTADPSQPSGAFPVLGPQPIAAPATPSSPPTQVTVPSGASRSIPPVVLAAYESAATELAKEQPNCHLPWELLGGIGYVESDNADNGAVNVAGEMLQPILGPALNGTDGFALILNTDPAMDGPGTYARAVGPMQFLPSTWQVFGKSATGRTPDPENVFDAALTTAAYLCDGGGDLSTRNGLLGAVYRYNQSWQYVSLVLTWAGLYAGAFPVTVPGATPTPTPSPTASPTPKPTAPAPTATPVPSASAPPSAEPTPTLGAADRLRDAAADRADHRADADAERAHHIVAADQLAEPDRDPHPDRVAQRVSGAHRVPDPGGDRATHTGPLCRAHDQPHPLSHPGLRVTKMAVPGISRPRSGLHPPQVRSFPSGHSGSTRSSSSRPAATTWRT